MSAVPRITLHDEPGLRVARLQQPRIYDDSTVREVFDQLVAALPSTPDTALVVDFTGVEIISSSMLGKLILLQRKVDTIKGRLRFCEMSSTVRAVFRSTNLDRLFQIDRDLSESKEALSGHSQR